MTEDNQRRQGQRHRGGYKLLNRRHSFDLQNMQITKLTENGKANQVAISPDGRYILYAMRDGEKQSLWVRNVATKSDVQVLAPDVVEIPGVSFSPDGNYIYFVRSDKSTENFRYLYQMPMLGGSPRQLIRDIDSAVDFSPDGSRLVFERGIPDRSAIEVWIAQADGSGQRLVATLPAYTGSDGPLGTMPFRAPTSTRARGHLLCEARHRGLPPRESSRSLARRCRRRTSPTSGASER
jgi:dipeptidyl aminopeptidase/acylaminoacyl peptidase